jgi:hexokinase
LAEAYICKETTSPLAGIIFGTGTNAAYTEKIGNIAKLHGSSQHGDLDHEGLMVINSEWGAWYDTCPHALPQTSHDKVLDEMSTNPNEQLFEKRTSAMYLAELTRLVILESAEGGLLSCEFGNASILHKPYTVDGSFLSTLANDYSNNLESCISCIEQTFVAEGVTRHDAFLIRSLAMAIVRRAARLSGAAIAALIIQSGRISHHDITTDIPLKRAKHRSWKNIRMLASIVSCAGMFFSWGNQDRTESIYSTQDKTVPLTPDSDTIVIGIDGSLFEFYPTFEAEIRGALRDIPEIGPSGEARVRFRLTRDGSSLGAALVAYGGLQNQASK